MADLRQHASKGCHVDAPKFDTFALISMFEHVAVRARVPNNHASFKSVFGRFAVQYPRCRPVEPQASYWMLLDRQRFVLLTAICAHQDQRQHSGSLIWAAGWHVHLYAKAAKHWP